MKRILVVDPSDRGGIAAASAAIGRALVSVGARPEVLGNRGLPKAAVEPYPIWRWLPMARGRPDDAGLAYVSRRLAEWVNSAAALEAVVRLRRPSVIDFQAPFNQRFDLPLVRHVSRLAPVVWSVHDPLPLDGNQLELERFAQIYAAADLVAVHSKLAAEIVQEIAGIEPVILDLPVSIPNSRADRSDARRRLDLPEHGRILGALGFIRRYKGYDLLADVWERLGREAPKLLVMGELVDSQESRVLDRLQGTGRVELRIGYASEVELELAFKACDAILLPHAVASPSGLLAMAGRHRVPVIASDAPELVATVQQTRAGRIVPRRVEEWAAAVLGELPPRPLHSGPPEIGPGRLAAYERAEADWRREARWRGSRSRPSRVEGSPASTEPEPPFGLRVVIYTDSEEWADVQTSLARLIAGLPESADVTVLGVRREIVDKLTSSRAGTRAIILRPVRNKRDLAGITDHLRAIGRLRPEVFHASFHHPWWSSSHKGV